MKKIKSIQLLAAVAFVLFLALSRVQAQPGPGGAAFDPKQMQQMMNNYFRQQLNITNDEEWSAIEPLINKVVQTRMQSSGGMGFGRRNFGGNRNGTNGPAGPTRGFPGFGQPDPEADALQEAVDAPNAAPADITAKLEKLREARKKKQAESRKAQEDLREVLTLRQEATLVMMGVLD